MALSSKSLHGCMTYWGADERVAVYSFGNTSKLPIFNTIVRMKYITAQCTYISDSNTIRAQNVMTNLVCKLDGFFRKSASGKFPRCTAIVLQINVREKEARQLYLLILMHVPTQPQENTCQRNMFINLYWIDMQRPVN